MQDTIPAAAVWDFSDDRMAFLPSPGAARPAGAMQTPAGIGGPTVYASDSLVVQFTVVSTDLVAAPPAAGLALQPDPGPTVGGFGHSDNQSLPPVLPGALSNAPMGGPPDKG